MKTYLATCLRITACITLLGAALTSCDDKPKGLGDKVNDALDRRPNEKLKDAAEDARDAVKDAAKDVKSAVKDAVKDTKEAVKDATK